MRLRRLRDAEVDDLHAAVVADQDVRRRHVAMDDAERLAVGAGARARSAAPAQHAGDDRERVLRAGSAGCGAARASSSVRGGPRRGRTPSRRSSSPSSDRCRRPARCSGAGAAPRAAPRRGTSSTKRGSRRELGADPLDHDVALEAPIRRARARRPRPCRRSRGAPGSRTCRTVREASTSPSGLHPFRSIVNCLPSTGQRAPRPTSRCQIAPPHPLRICLILVLAVRGKRHA